MLSTPADFSFFNDCYAASTSLRRMRWLSSVSVWEQFSADGSPLALCLYCAERISVYCFSISSSSVRHFPERSWMVVTFPCFTVSSLSGSRSWYALLLLFFLRFSVVGECFQLPCSTEMLLPSPPPASFPWRSTPSPPPALFPPSPPEWPGSFTCHWGITVVDRTPNKSQHIKSTLDKKILPPLLPGFELVTFRLRSSPAL